MPAPPPSSTPGTLPRYLEIERALREEIARLEPGDPLPSDAELCARFGVSRMTARHGVQRLADLGLLRRVQGQGTFVAEAPIHRRAGSLLSFSDEMRSRGLRPHSRLLHVGRRAAEARERAALGLGRGDGVAVVRRLRLASDAPMAVELAVLPRALAGVLAADLEAGSLHAALEDLGHPPVRARGQLEPTAATREDADLLEIEAGTALLVERRVVFDEGDHPIELTETRYSPSRYVFDIELRREGGTTRSGDPGR